MQGTPSPYASTHSAGRINPWLGMPERGAFPARSRSPPAGPPVSRADRDRRPAAPQRIEDGGSPATGPAGQAMPPRRYSQRHRSARRTPAERDRPNQKPTDAGTRDHHREHGRPEPRDERIAQHAKRDAMRPATAGEDEPADKPTKPENANTRHRASRETAPSHQRATRKARTLANAYRPALSRRPHRTG